MRRIFLIIVLMAFLALTTAALLQHGLWGIINPLVTSTAGAQVFVDLIIALSMFLVWMWCDAKAAGRSPWPWILLTLATGSIGSLVYLIRYKSSDKQSCSES